MRASQSQNPDIAAIQSIAARLRGKVIEMSHKAQSAHLASSLSCCDILAAAYWHAVNIDPSNPTDPERDRFILSKGHAASALYATLAERGFFPEALLDTYCESGSILAEHPPANLLPVLKRQQDRSDTDCRLVLALLWPHVWPIKHTGSMLFCPTARTTKVPYGKLRCLPAARSSIRSV